MSEIITIQSLSKKYNLGETIRHNSIRDKFSSWFMYHGNSKKNKTNEESHANENDEQTLMALRDVSFSVQEGEIVGIIGRNGAGKSTLLKILSRITEPTSGKVIMRGRVASLLEVGTGFHPELTGRENVYLNGAILGMSKIEINKKFDEIVSFAEIEKFLDTPVKRYSSGMYVRLAFAVAAHLEPEILLVDEVLAVGDFEFQKKCLGKMNDVAKGGRTVLFVSHNLATVTNLCSYCYLLDKGKILSSGNTIKVINDYIQLGDNIEKIPIKSRKDRKGNGSIKFFDFFVIGKSGLKNKVICGEPVSFIIQYESDTVINNVQISIGIFTIKGEGVCILDNNLTGKLFQSAPLKGVFTCDIGKLQLLSGIYSVNLYCSIKGVISDWIIDADRFSVVDGDYFGSGKTVPVGYGHVAIDHSWKIVDKF